MKKIIVIIIVLLICFTSLIIIKSQINIADNNSNNIKDKENPVIETNDTILVNKGVNIDLLKFVKVTDNSNEEVNVEVLGEYDINEPRKYNLTYKATDKSGNISSKDFILIVNDNSSYVYGSDDPTDYFTTSKGFIGYKINGVTYIDGILIANKTYSLPSDYNPKGLTNEVKDAMNTMFSDAKKEGLNIYLSSGFRYYETQEALYARYSRRDGSEKADTYSARAGHSEHQSGLAFDVNQINSTFDNTPEAIWLENNSYKYGFILRYPKDKMSITGYKYESWHYRYVGVDLATKLYNNGNYLTVEEYFGITSEY